MAKRHRGSDAVLLVIACLYVLFALLFFLDQNASMASLLLSFGIGSLLIGITFLAYSSSAQVARAGLDWPMIQGLMDILLAIALFLSANTLKNDLMLCVFAIWALASALTRFLSALRVAAKPMRTQLFVNAGACLLAALVFLLGAFVLPLSFKVSLGVGFILYAFGCATLPRRKTQA